MNQHVPKTNIFAQIPEVYFPVVCWIFDDRMFQHVPRPGDSDDDDGDTMTKSPRGSRPRPSPAPRKKIGVRDPRTGYFGPWVRVVDWAWTLEETSSRPRRRRPRRRRHPGGGVMLENPIIENPTEQLPRSVGGHTKPARFGLRWTNGGNRVFIKRGTLTDKNQCFRKILTKT